MDVLWIGTTTRKTAAVLSTVDGATGHGALRAVKSEMADAPVKAVERGWIRQLEQMGELRTDDGSSFAPEHFTQSL